MSLFALCVSFAAFIRTFSAFILSGNTLYGEFKGKGNNENELKLVFLDIDLYKAFCKDLKICKKLMEPDIHK